MIRYFTAMRRWPFLVTGVAILVALQFVFMGPTNSDAEGRFRGWKRFSIGPTMVEPDGSAGATYNNLNGYYFLPSATKSVHTYFTVPEDYCSGSAIQPSVTWIQNSTSDGVKGVIWSLAYSVLTVGSDQPSVTTANKTVTFNPVLVNATLQKTVLAEIPATSLAAGRTVLVTLARAGGETADNATASALWLKALNLDYQDCGGSFSAPGQ